MKKKIILALSLSSALLVSVGCNRDENKSANTSQVKEEQTSKKDTQKDTQETSAVSATNEKDKKAEATGTWDDPGIVTDKTDREQSVVVLDMYAEGGKTDIQKIIVPSPLLDDKFSAYSPGVSDTDNHSVWDKEYKRFAVMNNSDKTVGYIENGEFHDISAVFNEERGNFGSETVRYDNAFFYNEDFYFTATEGYDDKKLYRIAGDKLANVGKNDIQPYDSSESSKSAFDFFVNKSALVRININTSDGEKEIYSNNYGYQKFIPINDTDAVISDEENLYVLKNVPQLIEKGSTLTEATIINLNEGEYQKLLPDTPHPNNVVAVSHDGQTILFSSYIDGDSKYFTIPVTGGEPTPLEKEPNTNAFVNNILYWNP